MKKAKAVIGSGYGDEGKGLMTDFHARQGADVVVRSNGGAQAGHTVVLPDGRRHVFHHFGAGSLAGVSTHLSRYFVSNPMFFIEERDQLIELGACTDVTVDPRGYVTTPYDIMINQIVEEQRGSHRHGSCGLGFGETIERCENEAYLLDISNVFLKRNELPDRLRLIRSEWVPKRLRALGVKELTSHWNNLLSNDGILDSYLRDLDLFFDLVNPRQDRGLKGHVLFEGAQGLLLDQDYGHFPHVTRSNTGLKNMVSIAAEAGITDIDVTYVTRAYATRHGAGPLEHEGEPMSGIKAKDDTNVINDWQGKQRIAPLDIDLLSATINTDLKHAAEVRVHPSIAVTCLDQVDDVFSYVSIDGQTEGDTENLIGSIEKQSKIDVLHRSTKDNHEGISNEFP